MHHPRKCEHPKCGRTQEADGGRETRGKEGEKEPELKVAPGSSLVFLLLVVPRALWDFASTCGGRGV